LEAELHVVTLDENEAPDDALGESELRDEGDDDLVTDGLPLARRETLSLLLEVCDELNPGDFDGVDVLALEGELAPDIVADDEVDTEGLSDLSPVEEVVDDTVGETV
jgi:hypothetical protein